MKNLILFALVLGSSAAFGQTHTLQCSNAAGTFKAVVYETSNEYAKQLEKSEITILANAMDGVKELKFPTKTLKVQRAGRVELASNDSSRDTGCGIPMKTKQTRFVETITISKKDGKPVFSDDTPESSPKKITETVICEESITDAWPCKQDGANMKNIIITLAMTLAASTSLANTYSYNCFSYYWNGYEHQKGTMTLIVSDRAAAADIVEESWEDGDLGGATNPKYKSKGAIKFVKFGDNLILEEALVSGGKQLNDGSLGGIARAEGEAEGGFYQYKFVCKR